MAFGMMPAKKSPMVSKSPPKRPPPTGDDFKENTTLPNKTTPTMPDRDGPAQDLRVGAKAQKPPTTGKAQNGKGVHKQSQKAPPAKAPQQSSMPQKTIDAMRASLAKM